MRTVRDMKRGESSIVESFTDESLSCKLLTMGILPHAKITMVRKAPFGGAYYLKLNGLNVAIRNNEAEAIRIKS